MKKNIFNILSLGALLLAMTALTGCSDEKEIVVIEGNLPIKTSALYMVGDATPAGWNIDNPVQMTQSEEDPMTFTYTGALYAGELKCPLTTGNWGCTYLMPVENGCVINSNGVAANTFNLVPGGDPDYKWRVEDAGNYTLTFDLRNWTFNVEYLGKAPVETGVLYMVGDATPAGWNIDAPTELQRTSTYVFTYTGHLNTGELKCPLSTGDWGCTYIMPVENGCIINSKGVADPAFNVVPGGNPDNKWRVEEEGDYTLTFDLQRWTLTAVKN